MEDNRTLGSEGGSQPRQNVSGVLHKGEHPPAPRTIGDDRRELTGVQIRSILMGSDVVKPALTAHRIEGVKEPL